MVTTVTNTPTTTASKNGDLPNIKPLKVNGDHTPTTEETAKPKLTNGTNGHHHHEEKSPAEEKTPEADKTSTKKSEDEPAKTEINGTHQPTEDVVA